MSKVIYSRRALTSDQMLKILNYTVYLSMHASTSFAGLLSLGMLGTAVGEITGPMWTYDISKFPSEKLKKAIQPKGKRCNLVIQPSSLEGLTKVRRSLLVDPYISKATTSHEER
jgi:hypothetical protein